MGTKRTYYSSQEGRVIETLSKGVEIHPYYLLKKGLVMEKSDYRWDEIKEYLIEGNSVEDITEMFMERLTIKEVKEIYNNIINLEHYLQNN